MGLPYNLAVTWHTSKCVTWQVIILHHKSSWRIDYHGCENAHPVCLSHINHGPRVILAPVRFLARKAEWSARTNFIWVLFSGSNQATGPVRLDTAVHSWFHQIIRRTPHGPRAMPVRVSYGSRTGISNVLHFLSDSYGARVGLATMPHATLMDTYGNWHNQNLQKSRTVVVCGRTARACPLRSLDGLFTSCLRSLNPYGAHKLITHASVPFHSRAPYGLFPGCSRAVLNKNRTSTHGARTGPVRRHTNFASPYGTRRVLMHAL